MRSKTSCFNGTLFRKNLSRYWPLWGLASFGGAMFPLAMLLDDTGSSQKVNCRFITLSWQKIRLCINFINIMYNFTLAKKKKSIIIEQTASLNLLRENIIICINMQEEKTL